MIDLERQNAELIEEVQRLSEKIFVLERLLMQRDLEIARLEPIAKLVENE